MKMKKYYFLIAKISILLLVLFTTSCGDNQKGLEIRSVKDIDGKKIVVATGTIQEKYAIEHFKKSEIMRVDAAADQLSALESRKADVAICDNIIIKVVKEKNPKIGVISPCIKKGIAGFIFNKKRTDLKEKFNKFLKKLQDSGEQSRIADKWLNHSDTATMPVLKNDGSGGSVVFASSCTGPPFTLIKNGKPSGSDIEVVERFAAAYNIKINYAIVSFSGIISGVATGKFDMASDDIAITEERAQKVDYSIPYIAGGTAALARKCDIVRYAKDTGSQEGLSKGFMENMKESFYNNVIREKRYELILSGLGVTAIIALASVIIGSFLGAILCFLRMRRNKAASLPVAYIIDFLRGVPPVVFLMILFYIVFASGSVDGIIVSIIGFSLIFAGYVSEMFRTAIESVDKGQWEAGVSMGFTKTKTFTLFVMPLAIRRVLPVYKGEFIGLIKNTSIVGYIAVQDLTRAGDIIRSATFDPFFPLILVTVIYFLLIWLLTRLLSLIDFKTAAKKRSF